MGLIISTFKTYEKHLCVEIKAILLTYHLIFVNKASRMVTWEIARRQKNIH